MAIMAMDTVQKRSQLLTYLVLAILPSTLYAGEWEFTPNIAVNETYSDNVKLTKDGDISSLVSQITLELENSYRAKHAELNFSSTSTYALFSHDHSLDDDFHTLDADFGLLLWPNGITLIGSAAITNQARNSARNALADIVSGDTVRVEHYSGGFRYVIDNKDFLISSQLRYQTTKAEDGIGDQHGYTANLSSKNGAASRSMFWDLDGVYQNLKNDDRDGQMFKSEIKFGLITNIKFNPFIRYYDEGNKGDLNSGQSIESNSYGAGIRWLILPRLFLDLSYNTPIGNNLTIDGEQQKDYLDAKFQWQPSIRTTLAAGYSQRFYGDSYQFNLNHKNKRLTNTINYDESVQTLTRNNLIPVPQGMFWCPMSDVIDINNCLLTDNQAIDLDNYQLVTLTDFDVLQDYSFSLNKTLQWTSELALARTTFSLNLGKIDRENLSTRQIDKSKNANFSIKRRVSGRSDLSFITSYKQQQLGLATEFEREDRYRQYAVKYHRELNSKLAISFDLSHVNRSSDQAIYNYEESRVSAIITKGF